MKKALTVVIPLEVYEKLLKTKEKTGISISFQIKKILQEKLKCK